MNHHRSIKCLNNNTVYKSIKEASEKLNLTSSGISNVLYGRIHTTKGFTFEFVKGAELKLEGKPNKLMQDLLNKQRKLILQLEALIK